ncbi:hypothetical protein [Roseimaritima sediminicola]|uniref:hypothetical protein n=1 Tax=Roseimaritima sediminicola TaxID=2662066 RepID=UPI00129849EB|nr:hypothetical protein [Roseimaritima sediminicola]
MARRARANDDDISLFPFLSIIASVIGVLTMMIATLALAQTDNPDIAQIEQYQAAQKQVQQLEEKIETLQREIAVSNNTGLQLREEKQLLDMTLEELEELLAEQEAIDQQLAEQEAIKVVIPEIKPRDRETVAEMQTQLQELREQLAQLEKRAEDAVSASQTDVTVLPQGSGLDFVPHFVECDEGSLVLHHLQPPKRIRAAEMTKDEDFLALLEQTLNGKDDTIVFLVRSDALNVYRAARKLCRDRDIRNGKIPVVGEGRIDLSAFGRDESSTAPPAEEDSQ